MSKLYVGERSAKGLAAVTVNGELLSLKRSQKVRNHSPDGFEWGYSGSGPAQLALAILLDVTGDKAVAEANYQDFKRQFVANWGDRWELTDAQVREWLSLDKTQVVEDAEWGPLGENRSVAIPVDPGPFTAEELAELDRLDAKRKGKTS